MSERPVFHADLGERLRSRRADELGWSLRRAARTAKERQLPAVTAGALQLLEKGRIRVPERELLQQVAALYGLSYTDLVVSLFRKLYGGFAHEQEAAQLAELAWTRVTDDTEEAILRAWRRLDAANRAAILQLLRVAAYPEDSSASPQARGKRRE